MKKKLHNSKIGSRRFIILAIVIVLSLLFFSTSISSLRQSMKQNAITPTPTKDVEKDEILSKEEKEKYIEQSIQDLSANLSIDRSKISVNKVYNVEWNNSSLGCPEKDEVYLQVIIPGFKITLDAQGELHEYHAGSNRVVRCQLR